MVVRPMGPTWPFRGLEAGKELIAWNLMGEEQGWSFPEKRVFTISPQCTLPSTDLVRGWRVRRAL